MRARRLVAVASCAAAAAAGEIVLLSAGGSSVTRSAAEATATPAARAPPKHPRGVLLGCSRRSEANFPGAYAAPDNLVVGPLALIGGAYSPASVVREFGGNKFPLLVEAGHTVTLRVSRRARRSAGLAYGGVGRRPLPQGRQTSLRDAARTMTFRACRPGSPPKDDRPEGPSGSHADGESVTFWSGFVLARAPACVPLEVYVDDEPPRRIGLALGRRCGERPIAAAACVRDRVTSEGVRGARSLVRFTACRPKGEPGWPGGIVVAPRCGTSALRALRASAVERCVPLGRRC